MNVKLGVSAYSFQKKMQEGMTYYDVCQSAVDMGYEGIEFIDLDLQYGDGEETIEELAKNIHDFCRTRSLPIIAYTVSADFLSGLMPGADEVKRVCRCVDIAVLLGAPLLRHDSFRKMWDVKDWREGVERIAPDIRRVTEYAESKGIRTCTENHGFIMQDSERVETLIRTVNHPNYGWLADMGNFLCADEDPVHAMGIAAPYAFHVHVKDFLFKDGSQEIPGGSWILTRGGNFLRGTVVGHGCVPVRACLRALKKASYNGYISVEFEGMEEVLPALRAAKDYLTRLLELT